MGSEMTVPTWEPEYTQLPIRLRSFRGDHFAVKKQKVNGRQAVEKTSKANIARRKDREKL